MHFGLAFHAESVYTLPCTQIAIRLQFRQLKHFSSLRLSQFSKIVPIKMAYLRYAVCGCYLCIKNANCYILGEDVKWCGGCARRRGADFILSVKWLCAPRGPEAELVFSLSWFSRRWRGGCFLFWSSGLRSARARWWRGGGFLFWSNGFALRAGQR